MLHRAGGRKAHFFTAPLLATPAHAIFVDDARAGTTASRVFRHSNLRFFQVNNWRAGDLQPIDRHISFPHFSVRGAW